MYKLGFIAVCSLATIGGCVDDGEDGAAGAAGAAGADGEDGAAGSVGPAGPQLALPGVYTLANAAGPNQVATNGTGLGAGIGSQGAIVFDAASQRFFAVNPGDDSISMLAIDTGGNLTTLSKVASGGKRPISITAYGDTVYVANQGDIAAAAVNANISGFKVQGGSLVAIASSTRPLSATTDVHPTDIAFTPDGKFLVVAERFTSKLDTFAVVNGVAQAGNFQTSAGMQPFAFDFSPEGNLLVAEVGTGGPTTSSVSSYSISATGALTPITSALATGQGAACWIVMAGGHAYVANAASGTITGLDVAVDGMLALREPSGVTATPGAGAIDLAVTPDRGFLYSLGGNPRTISIYEIGSDGSLAPRAPLTDVPAAAVGLVAR
jgi:6-phosphogluconolactonase (cycloisomerase 2 family)